MPQHKVGRAERLHLFYQNESYLTKKQMLEYQVESCNTGKDESQVQRLPNTFYIILRCKNKPMQAQYFSLHLSKLQFIALLNNSIVFEPVSSLNASGRVYRVIRFSTIFDDRILINFMILLKYANSHKIR